MASNITLYDSEGNPQVLTGDDIAQMGGMPVGGLINFGGVTAPAGFLVCDGTEVAQATYPDLYGAIGDVWGVAVDPLNFVLPNQAQNGLGNFMRGVGAVAVGDYQADAFKEHNHSSGFNAEETSANRYGVETGLPQLNTNTDYANASNITTAAYTSSVGEPTETRPMSMTTLMCIKAIHAVENLALVNVTQLMAEMQSVKASLPDPQSVATAWCTHDKDIILDEMNIASITFVETGIYAVVFTTPMDNVNYSVVASSQDRVIGVETLTNTVNGFNLYIEKASDGTLGSPFALASFQIFGGKN